MKASSDRVLIIIALLLLILAGSAYYFEGGSQRARGASIGQITARSGDVRLKYGDDLKWSTAAIGQDLAYDDAVYAGSDSEAKLSVGQSQMTVQQNSLVVLRRDQDENFLRLNYGALFGNLAKNDKIVIDTGDGRKLRLRADQNTKIVLKRDQGKTQFNIVDGEASVDIDGHTQKLTKSSGLTFADRKVAAKPALPPPAPKPPRLIALKPLSAALATSPEPTRLEFQWGWQNQRRATEDEQYVVEFAAEPTFKSIHATKAVRGALTTSLSVSQSLALYYRVRGPHGELSQVERVRFLRTEAPVLVSPIAGQQFDAAPGGPAEIDVATKAPAGAVRVRYQIARDPAFARPLTEREAPGRESLEPGAYFARARAEFAGGTLGAWSETRPFGVTERTVVTPLADRDAPTRALIPNEAYPADIYAASDEKVRAFLAERGFLQDFLPLERGAYDQVTIKGDDGRSVTSSSNAWPRAKLAPGRYAYRYQAKSNKAGYLPSKWSKTQRLEIQDEPPRPLGRASYGKADAQGRIPTRFGFTPLLFARSYDVQIARSADFANATELNVKVPRVDQALAPGKYHWRARARDAHGRLISAYSSGASVEAAAAVPQLLAAREPAADSISTKSESTTPSPTIPTGWYGWVGTGENFVQYNQVINGRGAANTHQVTPGSQYVEAGYLAHGGFGGALSYKGLPGKVQIDNAALASSGSYNWTNVSLEGVWRMLTNWTWRGNPVEYGVRAGVQLHRTPYLFLDENDSLSLRINQMTTASLGFLADWRHERWRYYSLLRYQQPMSAHVDGLTEFALKPQFAFDGSLGVSYDLTERWRLGAFWYGQFHRYGFTAADPAITNTGTQSLFYSSADLRLGYQF